MSFKIDYTEKLHNKIYVDKNTTSNDINKMISFFNYCFKLKNNFFVSNFNQKNLKLVSIGYNKIKTNILTLDCVVIFNELSIDSLKTMKYIFSNYINVYDKIKNDNIELTNFCDIEFAKRIINEINTFIKNN